MGERSRRLAPPYQARDPASRRNVESRSNKWHLQLWQQHSQVRLRVEVNDSCIGFGINTCVSSQVDRSVFEKKSLIMLIRAAIQQGTISMPCFVLFLS